MLNVHVSKLARLFLVRTNPLSGASSNVKELCLLGILSAGFPTTILMISIAGTTDRVPSRNRRRDALRIRRRGWVRYPITPARVRRLHPAGASAFRCNKAGLPLSAVHLEVYGVCTSSGCQNKYASVFIGKAKVAGCCTTLSATAGAPARMLWDVRIQKFLISTMLISLKTAKYGKCFECIIVVTEVGNKIEINIYFVFWSHKNSFGFSKFELFSTALTLRVIYNFTS